jgi:hypothetical protein
VAASKVVDAVAGDGGPPTPTRPSWRLRNGSKPDHRPAQRLTDGGVVGAMAGRRPSVEAVYPGRRRLQRPLSSSAEARRSTRDADRSSVEREAWWLYTSGGLPGISTWGRIEHVAFRNWLAVSHDRAFQDRGSGWRLVRTSSSTMMPGRLGCDSPDRRPERAVALRPSPVRAWPANRRHGPGPGTITLTTTNVCSIVVKVFDPKCGERVRRASGHHR